MRMLCLLLLVAAAGCGEDEAPKTAAPGGAKPAPKAGAKPGGKPPKTLVPKLRVEDRVTNETEKKTIRHVFKDRDFVPDQTTGTRDPFQSFVLGPTSFKKDTDPTAGVDITKNCRREDQMVAKNWSYNELRLVGIVAERAQRKVLMMDKANLGWIIKKGDCVGREKAVVKEIGVGFITFQVQPQTPDGATTRPVEEHSFQLYPNQLPVASDPVVASEPQTIAPVVTPGANTAPAPSPTPGGGAAPVVTPESPR